MSRPVRARRLTTDEGRYLLRLVRRGRHDTVRYRRALIIMASACGTGAPAIARPVAADPDTVRDVIHAFNAQGMAGLLPHWGGGRPWRITDEVIEVIEVIVAAATIRPKKLGLPFTHWRIRKLTGYLNGRYGHHDPDLVTGPGGADRAEMPAAHPARARHQLSAHSDLEDLCDPDYDAKLERIEEVVSRVPDWCFAFDQFGPLSIRPCHGTCWAVGKHRDRLRATYHRVHGTRYFHGCYGLSEDRLWGALHEHKGGWRTLAAFKTIRATRPGGAPIYIICDNLSANSTPAIRSWAVRHNVELCLTPTNASWADPIDARVRAVTDLHDGQLRLPQPRRAGP